MSTQSNQAASRIGFLREPEILRDHLPISRSLWWAKVKSGEYPKPVKLSARVTAWKRSDIEALCARLANRGQDA